MLLSGKIWESWDMAGEWSECFFENVLAVPLRNGLNRPKAVRGVGVKMVNMGELFAHSRIADVDMERVLLSTVEAENYLLQVGDLLFARQSLVLSGAGKCSIFRGAGEPVTFEGHLIRARLNREIADPGFYYYYFSSGTGRQAIESIVEQVAAAGIRGSDLAKLRVLYPPLPEQRAIAHILGTLDDKIELNRRMNETLEAMARALFKSWFVDFDPVRAKVEGRDPGLPPDLAALFPDAFQDSEMGGIPKGWHVTSVGDEVQIIKGVSYRSEELQDSSTALVTLKSINRGGGYRSDGLKPYSGKFSPDQAVRPGELVVAQTDVTQAAAVIGKPALVLPDNRFNTLVASLDLLIIRPTKDDLSSAFFYCLFLTEDFQSHIYGHTNGTTVLHLSKIGVPSYRFVRPQEPVAYRFNQIVQPLFERVLSNEMESRTLAAIRDALLPKLLSGELRMPEGFSLPD
jgi:type I restriction enzyme S subunit